MRGLQKKISADKFTRQKAEQAIKVSDQVLALVSLCFTVFLPEVLIVELFWLSYLALVRSSAPTPALDLPLSSAPDPHGHPGPAPEALPVEPQ